MNAGRSERRPIKIRRRGRHTAPSPVEKVATQAGKAAPAMAIAGALVAMPHAHSAAAAAKPAATTTATSHQAASAGRATLDSSTAKQVSGVTAHQTAGKALARSIDYKVKSGDTLSGIARTYYHKASDWQWLYHENDKRISDPNVIYPGQTLSVPADPPANYTLSAYVPRHAAPAATSSSAGDSDSDSGSTVVAQSSGQSSSGPAAASSTTVSSDTTSGNTGSGNTGSSTGSGSTSLSGTLSCSGLEQLWKDAGGNPADAFMAAEIAMAESGGNQYALSPTNDYGYWQINASNGALATFNAFGNAKAAITLSSDGTNWSPWTTFTSGAYAGRC